MINKSVNWKKVILLIGAMYFWYLVFLVLFVRTGMINLTHTMIATALLPFLYGANWYVCCYIIFCLFIPFLNKFLLSLKKKEFTYLLFLLFLFSILFPELFKMQTYMYASGMILFVVMYFIFKVIGIFFICTVLEHLRLAFIERWCSWVIDKYWNYICSIISGKINI